MLKKYIWKLFLLNGIALEQEHLHRKLDFCISLNPIKLNISFNLLTCILISFLFPVYNIIRAWSNAIFSLSLWISLLYFLHFFSRSFWPLLWSCSIDELKLTSAFLFFLIEHSLIASLAEAFPCCRSSCKNFISAFKSFTEVVTGFFEIFCNEKICQLKIRHLSLVWTVFTKSKL